MIISYLGQNVYAYIRKGLYYLEQLVLMCPKCISETISHGSYKRHIREGDAKVCLVIYRVLCCKCKATHAVIPDFMRPYKHYSACESELALRDHEDGVPLEEIESSADISTIRRWVNEFKVRGERAATELKSILAKQGKRVANGLDKAGGKIFPMLELLLEKLPGLESSHLTIGESNQWLTKCVAGVFI